MKYLLILLLAVSAFAESIISPITTKFSEANKYFGAAVKSSLLSTDTNYRNCLKDVAIITPEFEFKWIKIEPNRGTYDFVATDTIVNFCRNNNILLRGHSIMSSDEVLPLWLRDTSLSRDTIVNCFRRFVTDIVTRYRGRVYAWDIVNEALGGDGKIRTSVAQKAMGDSYVDSLYIWAAKADPQLKLFYNDDYFNCNESWQKKKLKETIPLLLGLKQRGVKIDGWGLEMHLNTSNEFNYNMYKTYILSLIHISEPTRPY